MTTVNSTASSSQLSSINGTKTTSTSSAQEQQDRFLKVLVAQMQNQDPLNPMDNAQTTSQMAQISTVSGIETLNDSIKSMVSQFSANQTLQATSMIGRGVLAPGNAITLASGEASEFAVNLSTAADNVQVSILDANGNTVKQENLGAKAAGLLALSWDGKNSTGAQMADGTYKTVVTATVAGKQVTTTPLSYSVVNSVQQSNGSISLALQNGKQISLSDVQQVF
jgi:flagellar basal-body rod modification protein FlgD